MHLQLFAMSPKKQAALVLKEAMEAKGWDAIRLAEESGVDVTLIRRYLHGQVSIGLKNAPLLAAPLGIEWSRLLPVKAAKAAA